MKNLIIYYSRSGQNYVNGSIKSLPKGNAELITEFIQNAVDADVFEVDTVKPYDKDYMVCIEEAKAELRANARPKLKEMLDDIHKRKIDMADAIYVINKDGYIGSSTKSEIAYAKEAYIPVRYFALVPREVHPE